MHVLIPVSFGELLDKISILSIKLDEIIDPFKRKEIIKEFRCLQKILNQTLDIEKKSGAIKYLMRLKDVNRRLWDIQIKLRNKERSGIFDRNFIRIARDEYIANDERFAIKDEVNLEFNSDIKEQKSYPNG